MMDLRPLVETRIRAAIDKALSDYKVTLFSGGKPVREWHTKGEPVNEDESDGFRFVDKATNKLILISGTVLIEQETNDES